MSRGPVRSTWRGVGCGGQSAQEVAERGYDGSRPSRRSFEGGGWQQGTVSMPFFRLSWLTACSILTFSAIPGAEKKL